MKALTVQSEWAMPVVLGMKTVEWRPWNGDYRGPLLICSSADAATLCIAGFALCVVNLDDVVPFKEEFLEPAMMDRFREGYAWIHSNAQFIKPFPVKGKRRLFEVKNEITYLDRTEENLRKYYEPLIEWRDPENPEDEEAQKEAHKLWEEVIKEAF